MILNARASPSTTATRVTGRRHQGRIVGEVLIGDRVRGIQDVTPETLRRLGGRELGAVHGSDDQRVLDALDGVDDRQDGDGAGVARVDRCDHALEHDGRRQGAGGVVHEHDLDIAPQGSQTRRHRRLARRHRP